MFYTYILKSQKSGIYYIGYTGNLRKRLNEHNTGRGRATRINRPWELFYFEEFRIHRDAVQREKQLKSWKSRKALERLKFKTKSRILDK